jgi:uncharacterized UPF0160 family protein
MVAIQYAFISSQSSVEAFGPVNGYEYCKLLPTEWGGRQKDFAGISDVHDALYCHNGCFLAEAKSLEGADKLAVIALEK